MSAKCRFCDAGLQFSFADLGTTPLCESYLGVAQLSQAEAFYPLHAYVCERCFLVQLEEVVRPQEIFSEYAYFSSFSDTWLCHAKNYTDLMVERFGIDATSQVIEIASNDGYLLQYFVEKGIPVLGVEPAANIAQVAIKKGIPSIVKFFGVQTARGLAASGKQADLLLGNNVLAHVPDLNDFVAGMKIALKPTGVITMEFPHLLRLMEENQFDTIYHEHFSYFSFMTAEKVFAAHGLTLFDVEELPTHGGSLRIYGRHQQDTAKAVTGRVAELRERELRKGFATLQHYFNFNEQVKSTKRNLLKCLIEIKQHGKSIAGYGAPGKGNTLLNYCGIKTDIIDYTVDRNPFKHYKFTPGTHIPIRPVEEIKGTKPDYLLILPWNLTGEIMQQMGYIREWGGKFIVPIPTAQVIQ